MFTLKEFDFGIDAEKSSIYIDEQIVTINVYGAPESVEKAEDDDEWSFILYPPHFYFNGVPCEISEDGDFSREAGEDDDDFEIGCYMLEHFHLEPCTVSKVGREIRVDAMLPSGLLSEPVPLTLRWQIPEGEISPPPNRPVPEVLPEIDLSDRSVEIDGEQAIWHQLSDSGPPVVFSGANSFPVAAYRPFLTRLAAVSSLSALPHRAQWPNTSDQPRPVRWNNHADDLISFLDATYDEPVLGVGHSMGAAAMLFAAARRPELFRGLVIIEPVLASRPLSLLTSLIPHGLLQFIEPMKSCAAKPDRWPDRSAAFETYRDERAYRRFRDEDLAQLVDQLLKPHPEGGFTLAYSKAWEGFNYAGLEQVWSALERIEPPVVAVRGRPSFFLKEEQWQKWQRLTVGRPTSFHELFAYGHLLPLEGPKQCAETVLKALRRNRLIET